MAGTDREARNGCHPIRPWRSERVMRMSLNSSRSVPVANAGTARRLVDALSSIAYSIGRAIPGRAFVRAVMAEHRSCWLDAEFRASVLQGVLVLIGSLIINYVAGTYASLHAGHAVRDIILDRVPTLPVDFIFIDGAFVFWAFVVVILLSAPRTIPFVLKTLSLFIAIRAFFVVLTHIGPPADEAVLDPNTIMSDFTFAGDLFFSGHTGFPFLLCLTFWESRTLRYIFLVSSVVFALAVLFGHLHYSIDVFAAFFITDSIFRITQRMFPEDYAMLSGRIHLWRLPAFRGIPRRQGKVWTDAHRDLL